MNTTTITKRNIAKTALIEALKTSGGDTKNEEVVAAIDTQTGKRVFEMKKSPKGILKLLYLDDELRITRGNRGTVLACQRQVEKSI